MSTPPIVFRAVWPITDENVPWSDLCRQAVEDLPALAAQARARLTAPGHFSIAPSAQVPGSGRITDSVLMYTAPAAPMRRRAYWKEVA